MKMGLQSVRRDRTAINRGELSRPVRLALQAGIINPGRSYFDYGCGRGIDLEILIRRGFRANGWDPVFRPGEQLQQADIVNLSYVINVIESPAERIDVLRRAYELSNYCLLISARLSDEARRLQADDYEDGLLTRSNTFQKFFEQNELRNWIESILGMQSVALAPGIFLAFRNEADRYAFVADRYRLAAQLPSLRRSDHIYEKNREKFDVLMEFIAWRGRLPEVDESPVFFELAHIVGSIKRAYRVVVNISDKAEWERITETRAQDLLIHIALSRFEGRPKFSKLPLEIRRDIRAFFSSYKHACGLADKLLVLVGDPVLLNGLLNDSKVGKLTPNALYVHDSAITQLHPVLRIYEGCARNFIGEVEGANILKLHRQEPKVSYLTYLNFDSDPHPILANSWRVDLQSFDIKERDYSTSRNPPILHRKEEFVGPEYPGREKFKRLTRQEEKWGLYQDTSRIGTKQYWDDLLRGRGLGFRGHRLIRI